MNQSIAIHLRATDVPYAHIQRGTGAVSVHLARGAVDDAYLYVGSDEVEYLDRLIEQLQLVQAAAHIIQAGAA